MYFLVLSIGNRDINSFDINVLITHSECSVIMMRLILHMRNVKQIVLVRLIQILHAFQHYEYLMDFIFANLKQVILLRAFLKVMRKYSIKPNVHVFFNIKQRESGFNYFFTFDFSSNHILIGRSMFRV